MPRYCICDLGASPTSNLPTTPTQPERRKNETSKRHRQAKPISSHPIRQSSLALGIYLEGVQKETEGEKNVAEQGPGCDARMIDRVDQTATRVSFILAPYLPT